MLTTQRCFSSAGQSNPTFLIQTPSNSYVLRKQPPGELLPGAHKVNGFFYQVIQQCCRTQVTTFSQDESPCVCLQQREDSSWSALTGACVHLAFSYKAGGHVRLWQNTGLYQGTDRCLIYSCLQDEKLLILIIF